MRYLHDRNSHPSSAGFKCPHVPFSPSLAWCAHDIGKRVTSIFAKAGLKLDCNHGQMFTSSVKTQSRERSNRQSDNRSNRRSDSETLRHPRREAEHASSGDRRKEAKK